jgi:hypothetical protein
MLEPGGRDPAPVAGTDRAAVPAPYLLLVSAFAGKPVSQRVTDILTLTDGRKRP